MRTHALRRHECRRGTQECVRHSGRTFILVGGMKRTEFGAWLDRLRDREDQVSIILSFVIGAVVGLIVVAFILLTGRLAARMYPPGSAPLRRILIPTLGALLSGYLLFRYFPNAR